ncbi:MAG: hypothetical protein IPK04_20260 [Bdellovibrionales bacterium]|nr:hypothetical protein [Bdellovibrionales bacterium]
MARLRHDNILLLTRGFLVFLTSSILWSVSLYAEDAPKDAAKDAPKDSTKVTNIVDPAFLEAYPHLKDHLYREPSSDSYFGFSLAPVGLLKNRMIFMMNFFQAHRVTEKWDWEILSTSFGLTNAKPASAQSYHFVFRTVPKYRLTDTISLGPVIGLEYVSFPKAQAFLSKAPWTTEPEDFSSRGAIYGLALSQIFGLNSDHPFRVTEFLYQQTYSTEHSADNWKYIFTDNELNKEQDPIKAGPVFLVEFGYMF